MTTLILDTTFPLDCERPQPKRLSDPSRRDEWFARMLLMQVQEIYVRRSTDEWDDEPSELSHTLQRSLDSNNNDTSVPASVAQLQAKAVRNTRDE